MLEPSCWPRPAPAIVTRSPRCGATIIRRWLFTIAHRRSVDEIRRLVRSAEPSALAEAVMLFVVNELSAADVAEIMETTEGNSRVLVHRGVTRLRRRLSVTDESAPTMKRVP